MTKVSNKNYVKFSFKNTSVNLLPRNGSIMQEHFFPPRKFSRRVTFARRVNFAQDKKKLRIKR